MVSPVVARLVSSPAPAASGAKCRRENDGKNDDDDSGADDERSFHSSDLLWSLSSSSADAGTPPVLPVASQFGKL